MCKIMDDTIKDVMKERDKETAKRMIALGDSSLSNIAKVVDLPLSTIEQLAQSMGRA